ncbi:MAG: c-type cytochrome [Acidimicrobiales bacterium]
MPVIASQAVLATAASAIGGVIAVVLIVGFIIAVVANMRRARPEIGAELELAANRKPYLSDEELEGKKLDRTLGFALALLAVIALALPLYWLAEPGRQSGAVEAFKEEAISRGATVYNVKAKCSDCHGPAGVGGVRSYTLLNANGDFVAQVSWKAPALNTVLFRYSKDEVKYILNYGRQNTPMPAWGAPGGGPLTDQQLDNVIAYLYSIQLSSDDSQTALQNEIDTVCKPDDQNNCTLYGTTDAAKWKTLGEALFNMGEYDGFASGAYSCARCHTKGWSYGMPEVSGGGGALGFNLTGGSELRQFETATQQQEFVSIGSELGKPYGKGGIGSGQMPGFGLNPSAIDPVTATATGMNPAQTMYTQDQIAAVVAYERSL